MESAVRTLAEQVLQDTHLVSDDALATIESLIAKIDDAQVRLNAILEKLPRAKGAYDAESQLGLLPTPHGDGDAARRGGAHGEHA